MKKIGISFSGGGARGAAHIGVLKALAENQIFPEVIAGTSAGSIIGCLYAAGTSFQQMEEFVKKGSLLKVMKWGMPYDGLTKLDYLKEHLETTIQARTFGELKKPLFIAATNLLTGESEIFVDGPLLDAVVASSSIPLVFKPVEINGQLYVDGGVMLNMPVQPLLSITDYVIGVNVRPRVPIDKTEVKNMVGIAQRIFDLSLQGNMRTSEALCDIVIAPPELHQYTIFQFNKWQELIEIGYRAGLEAVPLIKAGLAR